MVLALRGILSYEILLFALQKRHRVNFGNNEKSKKRIAVPFRAKDISSERTEFGHPDVAIILTQITYYCQGLSDL